MSVPIPNYLKQISVLQKQSGNTTSFSLKCTCGCNTFFVYQNYLNKEEKALEKPYVDALTEVLCLDNALKAITRDEDGNSHYWRLYEPHKGLDGKREEMVVPARPFFCGIVAIKIKCADCGKEYLLFDSRIHGYDGMTGKESPETMRYEPHFKLKCREAVSLSVKVENDESFEEFRENGEIGFSEEQYSDAFTWIWIYKTDKNGKKTPVNSF